MATIEARAYFETLRGEGLRAVVTQGEEKLLVRIRTRGHPDVTFNAAAGHEAPTIRARRIPRRGLKWLHKALAQVLPTDIEDYIHDRLD